MHKKNVNLDLKWSDLRKRAEEILKNSNYNIEEYSSNDLVALIEDLQIHQIELELQNQELQRVQEVMTETSKRFYDLFHWAPIGYVVLDKDCFIVEVNYTFTSMMDWGENKPIGKSFIDFIDAESKSAFMARYKAFFNNPAGKIVETNLLTANGEIKYVLIEGAKNNFSGSIKKTPTNSICCCP